MRAAPSGSYTGTPGILGIGGEVLSSLGFQTGISGGSLSWTDTGTPLTSLDAYGLTSTSGSLVLQFDAEL